MTGIDGLDAGDAVTAEQMRALFGAGMHPLAAERLQQLAAADSTDANMKAATRLGAPFKVYAGEVSPFRIEVAKRIATRQTAARQLADESVSAALRAQVRTEVAREFFRNPAWPHDDHPAAALWWRILDQLPETPNQEPATPEAVPATRCTTTRPFDRQPPVPRLAPPPAFGRSR
jgi:hypothetical protein